jgi:hypothetical protein
MLLAAATKLPPDHSLRNLIVGALLTIAGAVLSLAGSAWATWWADRRVARRGEAQRRRARALALGEAVNQAHGELRTLLSAATSGVLGVPLISAERYEETFARSMSAITAIRSVHLEAILAGWPAAEAVASEALNISDQIHRHITGIQLTKDVQQNASEEANERVRRLDTLAEEAVRTST